MELSRNPYKEAQRQQRSLRPSKTLSNPEYFPSLAENIKPDFLQSRVLLGRGLSLTRHTVSPRPGSEAHSDPVSCLERCLLWRWQVLFKESFVRSDMMP